MQIEDFLKQMRVQMDTNLYNFDLLSKKSFLSTLDLNIFSSPRRTSSGSSTVNGSEGAEGVSSTTTATSLFEFAAEFYLKVEGGYTVDTGGPTMRGVTLTTYNAYARKNGLTAISSPNVKEKMIQTVTKALAIRIYKANYWDNTLAGFLEQVGLKQSAFAAFDISLNSGPGRVVDHLSSILGVDKSTVAVKSKINTSKPNDSALANKIAQKQIDYRRSLVKANPGKYGAYSRGWESRGQRILSQLANFPKNL